MKPMVFLYGKASMPLKLLIHILYPESFRMAPRQSGWKCISIPVTKKSEDFLKSLEK